MLTSDGSTLSNDPAGSDLTRLRSDTNRSEVSGEAVALGGSGLGSVGGAAADPISLPAGPLTGRAAQGQVQLKVAAPHQLPEEREAE